MDLISRQAAIDAIKRIRDDCFPEWTKGAINEITKTTKNDCIEELQHLPSAQSEVTAEMVDSYVKPRHLRVISEEFYKHLTTGKYLPPPLQLTQPERQKGEWDMFELITSAWYGKQCYFLEDNGMVYSRLSARCMSEHDALMEFLSKIGDIE